MKFTAGFFMKDLTQPQKDAFIVHFRNLGVQKFLQTLKMALTLGHSKDGKKPEKSWKKL